MKLLPKFALLSIGVAAVPLAIAGYSSIRVSQAALREAIEGHEVLLARQIAEYVSSQLANLQATMKVETRIHDLTQLGNRPAGDEFLRKFLHLIYHQSDDFSVVALLDKEGEPLVRSAFQSTPIRNASFGDHEIISPEEAAQLPLLLSKSEVLKAGSTVGGMLITGAHRTPHVTLAVRYDNPDGAAPRILAAAVSLRRIADHLTTLSSNDRDILLLDREGRIVISGRQVGPPSLEPKRLGKEVTHRLPSNWFVSEYESGGQPVIGAYIPIPSFHLGVVVERWVTAALRPARRLGITTAYWVGIAAIVAAVVGGALAQSLSRKVGTLLRGSKEIARGKLDMRLEVTSNDELGELARSFNAMASSLDAARDEIVNQTEEIRNWNATLEKRVEANAKELREAQDLLLRARSLAAIGSLGAGVAHEINNPLTGVLGLAQLLLSDIPKDHPNRSMVESIESEALRIQGIVANLLRFSQQQGGEDFRALNLAHVLLDALELIGSKQLSDAGITLVNHVPDPSPPIRGNPLQLQAAFIQILQNAIAAMEAGGTLSLETTLPGNKLLRLRIADTGRGIPPEHLPHIFDPFFTTKMQHASTGIGLSVVHKIIDDHGGQIRAESSPGQGTTFWITLPIDDSPAILA